MTTELPRTLRIRPFSASCLGKKIFYLDSWVSEVSFVLRTTAALQAQGHLVENLSSANPDLAICEQLRREDVTVHHGTWAEVVSPHKFDGIFLDLCSGSEAYVRAQLELACLRAADGCLCGVTVTERDFNGDPLFMRAVGLADFMLESGWKPAMHRMKASMQLHRSFAPRLHVLTQFWRKEK